jgi:hypothetical protein
MTDAARHASRRLVLVDDEDGCRRLSQLLDGDPNIDVVSECPPGDAVAVVHQQQPDAALIGLDRELHSLELLSPIREHTPGCRLVVVSDFVDPWTLSDVLERGGHLLLEGAGDLPNLGQILDVVDAELFDGDGSGDGNGDGSGDGNGPDGMATITPLAKAKTVRHPKLRSWLQASVAAAALVAAAMAMAHVGGAASVPAERAYQHVLIGS